MSQSEHSNNDEYIDGFVFPVAREKIELYRGVANSVAKIYRELGALDYVEFIGDDMLRPGTRSFPDLVASSSDEVVIFGWIRFQSKASRDSINQKIEADPRMPKLVAPLMNPENPVFDPTRMAYGGFMPFISANKKTARKE